MPGRQFVGATGYRYGFNGKENDNEVKGDGNQQDYGLRIYDPRISKFLSVDPLTKEYPWYTPYQFAGNKPIWATDLDGAEENPTNNGSAPNTVITPPNVNSNPGFPEKNRGDFSGEYNKDFRRATPDEVERATKYGMENSGISYVPDANTIDAKKGDFFKETTLNFNANGTDGTAGNTDMQPMVPIQAQLNLPLPPDMIFVAVPQQPIIQNINAGQIQFGGGQWNLDAGSTAPINRIANILRNNPTSRVRVIGSALMNAGATHNTMSSGNVTFGALKQNRANSVMGALLNINPAWGSRINTGITPVGSNAQTIMFQVRTPNPQPTRWVLQPVPQTP